MTVGRKPIRWGALLLGGMLAFAWPAPSQRPGTVTALQKVEPGLWQLRDLDGDRGDRGRICLGNRGALLQLAHRNLPCSRLVVAQDQRSATVHYTCSAGGFGQTILTLETPRLLQVSTQGIKDNAPFSYRLQARRVGACTSGGAARPR